MRTESGLLDNGASRRDGTNLRVEILRARVDTSSCLWCGRRSWVVVMEHAALHGHLWHLFMCFTGPYRRWFPLHVLLKVVRRQRRWGEQEAVRLRLVSRRVDALQPLFGTASARLCLAAADMVCRARPARLRHAARSILGGSAGRVVDPCAPHCMGSDMSLEQVSGQFDDAVRNLERSRGDKT